MTQFENLLDLYRIIRLEELLFQAELEAGVYRNGAINPIL